ncbi:MAG: transcriptional repressor [Acidobacteria bacterium]|nr:transcriptional repressor [Acidobacteriota bacterium]
MTSQGVRPASTRSRETRQRAAVLDALRGGEALGAQELHARLRAAGRRVGLATVYRALRLLAGEGVLDVLRDDPAQARFRLCSLGHHHHLVCERCGHVEEIPDCDVAAWAARVARRRGFRVRSHRAEILGTCRRCSGAR